MIISRRAKVLVVSVEPLWPAIHGGRIRTGAIATVLADHFDVVVACPNHGPVEEGPVPTRLLSWRPPSWTIRLRAGPHLGNYWLSPVEAELREFTRDWRPDVIVWSHSYIAAAVDRVPRIEVIDFANLEHERLRRSFMRPHLPLMKRMARGFEYVKSLRWEGKVARSAAISVALSTADMDWLDRHGAAPLVVENGVWERRSTNSPVRGHVLFAASFDYEPNRSAADRVLTEVWPQVQAQAGWASLLVVGSGSEDLRVPRGVTGVRLAGRVGDIAPYYQGAATVLAPVDSGAGRQLKVTEAISWGRVVVASSYSSASAPDGAIADGAVIPTAWPSMADAVLAMLEDADDRWLRESRARQIATSMTWDRRMAPLVQHIHNLVHADYEMD